MLFLNSKVSTRDPPNGAPEQKITRGTFFVQLTGLRILDPRNPKCHWWTTRALAVEFCDRQFLWTSIHTEVKSSYIQQTKKTNKGPICSKHQGAHPGLQHNHVDQYAPWKDSRSRNVSKMEAAALLCASVIFRRPNSSSLSLACEAASSASLAMPIRAYAYTNNHHVVTGSQLHFLKSWL